MKNKGGRKMLESRAGRFGESVQVDYTESRCSVTPLHTWSHAVRGQNPGTAVLSHSRDSPSAVCLREQATPGNLSSLLKPQAFTVSTSKTIFACFLFVNYEIRMAVFASQEGYIHLRSWDSRAMSGGSIRRHRYLPDYQR
ncbi:uncharacterized protein FN964_007145 isoform 1-T5 [Alca torda]